MLTIVGYNHQLIIDPVSVSKKTASEIFKYCSSHLDEITQKFKDSEFLVTPIGTDCYSSFLAKTVENYIPSIFGFRNINPEFTSNYLNYASESSHFTLLRALGVSQNSIGSVSNFKLFGDTNIHCLENPFGMFLLNHDGGFDTPRPYTHNILQEDVLNRLAHLDITTHAFLFGLENCKRKIVVFSGSEDKKKQVLQSFRENIDKFSSGYYQVLFINLIPLLKGTDEPSISCDGRQINVQLFKQHRDYGNVAANWNNINMELIKNAAHLVQSNTLPSIN